MMWEMHYPFPYEDEIFVSMIAKLNDISSEIGFESYIKYHKKQQTTFRKKY